MTFFDKKQDVLKIELTPYGRSLLSNGKLMPKYYAFFDDDILYDIECIGGEEEQNEIKDRILTDTPRLRPQRDLLSPEGLISNFEREEGSSRPYSKLSLNYLTEPIGTSDGTENNASSWHFTTLLGEIDSVDPTLESDETYLRQIPQINMTLEYTMQVRNTRDDSPVRGQKISPTAPVSRVFEDGTYIELVEEQIIARILEENGFKLKEGLEIEAFLFEDDGTTLMPLKMMPRTKTIVDGLLVEPSETIEESDPTYVEYYIDLALDEAIPDSDLCKGISRLKKEDILLDIEVDCEDEEGIDFDIYRTRITDVEKC
jgi:hypothetical protein